MTAYRSFYLILLMTATFLMSCSKDDDPPLRVQGPNLVPAAPPQSLAGINAVFYPDIDYATSELTKFDLLLPESDTLLPLVIFIHGGGFTAGDKAQIYDDPGMCSLISELTEHNVAFATINYRLLTPTDLNGVLKCLNDAKRSLQYMRYYAPQLGIDPDNIVLMGSSAGAGTSLWIATHDDMADPSSSDPVLQESTRVRGAVCMETQATYDIVSWPDAVFSQYESEGLDLPYIIQLGTPETLTSFYGISSVAELASDAVVSYRHSVDMLEQLTADDPELYLSSTNQPYSFPEDLEHLNHHPLQARAVLSRGQSVGATVKAEIPAMEINTTGGENTAQFILRKLQGL